MTRLPLFPIVSFKPDWQVIRDLTKKYPTDSDEENLKMLRDMTNWSDERIQQAIFEWGEQP